MKRTLVLLSACALLSLTQAHAFSFTFFFNFFGSSKVATPAISPNTGTYNSAQSVTITCSTAGATIYYTTNGVTPTKTARVYTGPFTVSSTTTVKARAFKSGSTDSDVASATLTLNQAAAPTVTASQAFTTSVAVSMSTSEGGATVGYTTDGSDPTASSGTSTANLNVASTTVLKVRSFKTGALPSDVVTRTYTKKVATPTYLPTDREFNGDSVSVTLSCATAGATIRYTTDGSEPSTSSTAYTGAITVSSNTTFKARAFKSGYDGSDTASHTYVKTIGAPVLSPTPGEIGSVSQVTMTSGTPGATIYYKDDGSSVVTYASGSPALASGYKTYSAASKPSTGADKTFSAVAVKDGQYSSVTSGTYSLAVVAKPTFVFKTPLGMSLGTSGPVSYNDDIKMELATATGGASIYWTTANRDPHTGDNLYTGPETLDTSGIVRARAFKGGSADSQVAVAAFGANLLAPPSVATPTIGSSPGSNGYRTVTLSCGTHGADIRYTTNGSSPVEPGTLSIAGVSTGSDYFQVNGNYASQFNASPVVSVSGSTGNNGSYTVTSVSFSGGVTTINVSDDVSDGTADGDITFGSPLYTEAVSLAPGAAIKAKAFLDGVSDSAIAIYVNPHTAPTVATPTFSQSSGTNFDGSGSVTISCETGGATIRYTTDGSVPTAASTEYTGAVTIAANTTLKAKGFKTDYTDSSTASANYTVTVEDPVLNPAGPTTFSNTQTVTITSPTNGASIYYSTDGGAPDTLYTGPLTLSNSATVKAEARKTGATTSSVVSGSYTKQSSGGFFTFSFSSTFRAKPPTFSPAGGTYTSGQSVEIATSTSGATIRYTTDGSEPTATSELYTGPVSVTASTTLKAKAFRAGYTDSNRSAADYVIDVVTLDPPSSLLEAATTVSMTQTTGKTVKYRLNGGALQTYTGPLTITATTTVAAQAYDGATPYGEVTSETYEFKVQAPTITEFGVTADDKQQLGLSTGTGGATILYSTDGGTPDQVYTSPIEVADGTTLKAKATKSGLTDSDVTEKYVQTKVSTPTFSLAGGTYNGPRQVSIACATPGVQIRYTTNGVEPSARSSLYHDQGLTVDVDTTLKAMAFKSGLSPSDVATATYDINGADLSQVKLTQVDGGLRIEAASSGDKSFKVKANYVRHYQDGETVVVTRSTANDGNYTVREVTYDHGENQTTIFVNEPVTNGADGLITHAVYLGGRYSSDDVDDRLWVVAPTKVYVEAQTNDNTATIPWLPDEPNWRSGGIRDTETSDDAYFHSNQVVTYRAEGDGQDHRATVIAVDDSFETDEVEEVRYLLDLITTIINQVSALDVDITVSGKFCWDKKIVPEWGEPTLGHYRKIYGNLALTISKDFPIPGLGWDWSLDLLFYEFSAKAGAFLRPGLAIFIKNAGVTYDESTPSPHYNLNSYDPLSTCGDPSSVVSILSSFLPPSNVPADDGVMKAGLTGFLDFLLQLEFDAFVLAIDAEAYIRLSVTAALNFRTDAIYATLDLDPTTLNVSFTIKVFGFGVWNDSWSYAFFPGYNLFDFKLMDYPWDW